jgi:voltage-gated potassium channel
MSTIRKHIRRLLALVVLVFFLGALGFWLLLEISFPQALYLTVVTLTTVGYGDISPLNNMPPTAHEGAVLLYTCALILFGMGFFLYVLGIFTEHIVSGEFIRERRERRMQRLIRALRGQYIVCGGGETGIYIMRELAATDRPFVVIESSWERLRTLMEEFPDLRYVQGDATRDASLLEAGLKQARGVVLALPEEKDNLFCSLAISQLKQDCRPDLRIVAKVTNWRRTAPKLRRAGADVVISPSYIAGRRMVSEMFRPTVTGFLDRMLQDRRAVMRVEEVLIGPDSILNGTTLHFSEIRERTGLVVIALRKKGEDGFVINPLPQQQIFVGDVLIVLGAIDTIDLLRDLAGERHVRAESAPAAGGDAA